MPENSRDQRNTKQRQEVYEAVMSRTDHPSADLIYLDIRSRDDRISRGTVYRNLKVLSEQGDITYVRVPGSDRYDLRLDRHYHVICTRCGRVEDVPKPYDPELDSDVQSETGFEINRHRMVFEGLCPECRKIE